MTSNMFPHDVDDSGSDERVFNDEGVEVGGGVLHYGAHNVDSPTTIVRDQCRWRQAVQALDGCCVVRET